MFKNRIISKMGLRESVFLLCVVNVQGTKEKLEGEKGQGERE